MSRADHYRTNHVQPYQKPNHTGYEVIECLDALKGEPWDERALDYVHALRPTGIRVVNCKGCVTDDAYVWRVTVILEEDDTTIKRIEQEVEVGLRTADNGYGLRNRLPRGSQKGNGMAIVNSRAVQVLKDLTGED